MLVVRTVCKSVDNLGDAQGCNTVTSPGVRLELATFNPHSNALQEVFHVYLNKFENAITHLFLAIFGNN